MTDMAPGGWDSSRSAAGGHNPWLIALVVSIATFMQVMDASIANVALQYIAGGLGASYDESTWILTSYLVANATIIPVSGWLATAMGRKRFYMICVAVFTVSSFLCALSPNLSALIVLRVLQGLGGGGMAPSEQSILADSFPPQKRGQAFALYGLAVVVAPAIGPTLGGWITDNYSWHWIFLINVPIGIVSLVLTGLLVQEPSGTEEDRRKLLAHGINFDFVGFVLIALGLGCLEMVLSRGQEYDWFDSNLILIGTVVCVLSLGAFVPWELSRKNPVVELRLLGHRQFGTAFLVMFAVGLMLFGTTQFIPQLLQQNLGYTGMLAGLVLTPGGVAMFLIMPIAGKAVNVIQPKYLIAGGMAVTALSMWHLTGINADISFSYAVWARILQVVGLPFVFVSVTSASYQGLPGSMTNQASALINVARNLGGDFGISIAQTLITRREQLHQAHLVSHLVPSSLSFQQASQQATSYFTAQGSSPSEASRQALAWLYHTVQTQAAMLSYIDIFWLFTIIGVIMIPVALLLRPIKLGEAPQAH